MRIASSANTKHLALALLLLAGAIAATWHHALSFGYTGMDDTLLIEKNQAFLQSPDAVLKAFTTDVFPAKKENDIFYRPLLTLSFWVDFQACGTAARCYHFTNLVLHMLAVFTLFFLLLELSGRRLLPAFVLSAIYALNPLLSTAVAFLPGRNDSLLSLFLFGAFYFMLRFAKQAKPAAAAAHLALLLAAFFTKENAVVAVPLFALWVVLFHRPLVFEKKMWLLAGGWALGLALFFFLRQMGLQNPPDVSFSPLHSFFANWFTLPHVVGKFFTLQNLQLIPIVPDMNRWVGLAGALAVGLLLLLSKNLKLSAFGLAWFVLLLLPALLFTNPAINYNFHYEHRTHTALFGLLLLIMAVFDNRKLSQRFQQALVVMSLVFAAAGAWVAHQYAGQVRHEQSYFSHAVAQSPHCSVCWGNLAAMQFHNQDFHQAEISLRKALASNPENPEFYTLLAKLYLSLNNVEEAWNILNRLDAAPEVDADVKYSIMTRFFIEIGDAANARTYLDKARIAGGNPKKTPTIRSRPGSPAYTITRILSNKLNHHSCKKYSSLQPSEPPSEALAEL